MNAYVSDKVGERFGFFRYFFRHFYSTYVFLLGCLVSLFCYLWISHQQEIKNDLKNEAEYICITLQETLESSGRLAGYLSRQIINTGAQNNNTIAKIITNSRNDVKDDSLSWVNIGWINAENFLVFDSEYGSIDPPCNLSRRQYVQDCIKTPGRFYTQSVVTAHTGFRIIPGGISVVGNKGERLGIICASLKLSDLNYSLQKKLKTANFVDPTVGYVVLDKNLHIVLKSPNSKIDIESSYYRDTLGSSSVFLSDDGTLPETTTYKDITYTYYKKINNFPYYVLVGVDKTSTFFCFLRESYPLILILVAAGIGCIALIRLNRRRMLSEAEKSERAKLKFINQIKEKTRETLDLVLAYTDILGKSFRDEIDINFSLNKKTEILDEIHRNIINVSNLDASDINCSSVDVNDIIHECVLIQWQSSLIRRTRIKTLLYPCIPPLRADKLRLMQVIVGFLSLSLEYSPKKSLIKIYTALKSIDHQTYLEIIIEDNGFPLDETAIHHIHEKLTRSTGEGMHCTLTVLKKIIKMHEGTLEVESQWNEGKKIIITLPYREQVETTDNFLEEHNRELEDFSNIVQLMKP